MDTSTRVYNKIVYIMLYTTTHCLMCIRSLTERVGALDLNIKKKIPVEAVQVWFLLGSRVYI